MQYEISTLLLYNRLYRLRQDPSCEIPKYVIDTSLKQLDNIGAVFINVNLDERTNLVSFESDDANARMAIAALNNSIKNKLNGQISQILFNSSDSESLKYSMLSYVLKDSDILSKSKIAKLTSYLGNCLSESDFKALISTASEAIGSDPNDDNVSMNYKYIENQGAKTAALLLYKGINDEANVYTFGQYCASLWYDKIEPAAISSIDIKKESGAQYIIDREEILGFLTLMCDKKTLEELKALDGDKFVLSAVSLMKQEATGQITAYNNINNKEDMLKVLDTTILDEVPEAELKIQGFTDTASNEIAKTILYYTSLCIDKRFNV